MNWACTAAGSVKSSSRGSSFEAQAVLTAGNRFLDAPPERENWFLVVLMFHYVCRCYRGTGQASSAKSLYCSGWSGRCFGAEDSCFAGAMDTDDAKPQPNCAKRLECVELAPAFGLPHALRQRQQAGRTPNASRSRSSTGTFAA